MVQSRYPGIAKFLHWVMAAIVTIAWCIGFGSAHLRGAEARGGPALLVHKAIASTVLFLLVVRLFYRWWKRRQYPALPSTISSPVRTLARSVHVLLYTVAMIATPLSGWLWSSVAGHPVTLLGLVNLPRIASVDPSKYDLWMWIHRGFAWVAGAVIALHVLAALKHHLVDRDDILLRMLPTRHKASGPTMEGSGADRPGESLQGDA